MAGIALSYKNGEISCDARAWRKVFNLKIKMLKLNLEPGFIGLVMLDHHMSDWELKLLHLANDMIETMSNCELSQSVKSHLRKRFLPIASEDI